MLMATLMMASGRIKWLSRYLSAHTGSSFLKFLVMHPRRAVTQQNETPRRPLPGRGMEVRAPPTAPAFYPPPAAPRLSPILYF